MDRSAEGQQRIASQLRRDLERANAFDASGLPHATRTSVEVVRSAYATALEGFAMPYGDVPVGGWRITPYVVIQNVGAYLDIPRFLDAEHRIEQRRGRRGVSGQAAVLREAGRRGAWPHSGGARERARAAGVPDRQGAGAAESLDQERARGRHARRVDRAAHEEHSRHLGRARAGDRGEGDRAGARAATGGTAGAARDRDGRCRHVGAAERRGVLPVGAEGVDDHHHVARRGPRDGPARAAAAARADGRDPEKRGLHAGERRRAHAGAGEGPALPVPRGRQADAPKSRRSSRIASTGSARRCRAPSTRSSIRTWK